jgi:hypothetical protein
MCEDTGLMAIELQEAGYLVVEEDDDLDSLSNSLDILYDWWIKKFREFCEKYEIKLEDD